MPPANPPPTPPPSPGDIRASLTVEDIQRDFLENLFCLQAKFPAVASRNDFYLALAYTVRHRLLHRWITTAQTYFETKSRTLVYLSAEYLLGPQLGNHLLNLGIAEQVQQALANLGLSVADLLEYEPEPGLGNGGLGRLAACYMDSLATLEIPAIGYGLRYEFGIFNQQIQDGWQIETTDKWLRLGNPWEIAHPEIEYNIKLGGHTEPYQDAHNRYAVRWIPDRVIKGTPCDMSVLGFGVHTANLLRLWTAHAGESLNFQAFNVGDYYGAVHDKIASETLTKVLYPNDEPLAGKQLRLEQQYFFVACSLQDMLRLYRQRETTLDHFHEKFAIQLNDTHPAIAVAELMRLLVDEYQIAWDPAWAITVRTFAYTNHTLLPEALEKWPVALFRHSLPRHLEIIYEINRRFLDQVAQAFPQDPARLTRLSLIEEGPEPAVRMAHLACVGSHAINGVAQLHTELLQATVLRDFYELTPEKFSNKTNGITPRRFLMLANPDCAQLITDTIGTGWRTDLSQLRQLEPFAADPDFGARWRQVKHANKCRLADRIRQVTGLTVNPDSLFDIQVKRIHEYKRQHLNVLHVITLYNRLKRSPGSAPPRTIIFGGKAAPGYWLAKLIIKLIHNVAAVIRNDAAVRDYLQVVFYPDFNVKHAHWIYPAAELSEQISTAGKEASGTGNMKFALNGALTIGTLDGANIEIRTEVGAENFFLFGLSAAEVQQRRAAGYQPAAHYHSLPELREALDQLRSGYFSGGDAALFEPLVRSLLESDEYLLLADYASYIACQDRVGRTYQDRDVWTRMSVFNTARMGKFSSDRAIREYCSDIWHIPPVHIQPA